MQQRRQIAAYGLCRDGDRVLLVGAGPDAGPTHWQVPGARLRHGEDPAVAVVRAFAEQAGLAVTVTGLHSVVADVVTLADAAVHTDRVVYRVRPADGPPGDRPTSTGDQAAPVPPPEDPAGRVPPPERQPSPVSSPERRASWMPGQRWAGLPLTAFTARLLGLPALPLDPTAAASVPPPEDPPGSRPRGRRFAAYGLVTDPAGRVLLTQIAAGYPGAGRWHLPGGGTDHGEAPQEAIRRELAEESGQLGRVDGLLAVSHRHDPAALGPEGHPVDWYVVRAVFRVFVDRPTEPVVTEAAGGSTLRSAWFPPDRLAGLTTTEVTEAALAALPTSGK